MTQLDRIILVTLLALLSACSRQDSMERLQENGTRTVVSR